MPHNFERHAACNIVVVELGEPGPLPKDDSMSNTSVPPASSPLAPYKILVAVDQDQTSDWALLEGLRLCAHGRDCEMHLVHAIGDASYAVADDAMREADVRLRSATDSIRERVERIWHEAGEHQIIGHVVPGRASDMILQTAIDIGADLVIVGTHRHAHTGSVLMLGSVAKQVLRRAHCPVLVAVPKDYTGVTPSERVSPPCADCVAAREQTSNETYWCERHSREHVKPHVYEPRAAGRTSVMLTY